MPAKKDYTITFHYLERVTPETGREVQVGVEFSVEENIDQLFGRIEAKFRKKIHPTDYITIRKNTISL